MVCRLSNSLLLLNLDLVGCNAGGVLTYKIGIYVPPYVKKKGAYGADQTEKVGAFRADRTVKVVPLELIELLKNGCIQKKWVLLELIELKK